MQKYTEIDENKTLRESRELLLNNDKTAISCSSGPAFPTINLQPGMLCFRTDEQKLYQLNADGETWVDLFDLSSNAGLVSRATIADNALKANGYTVNADVPVNAKFTDTTYGAVTDSASGLMTAAQKKKLDELSNYSLPVASATTLGGVKIGDGLTITNGILSSGVTGGNATHGEKLFTANDTFVVPEGVSTLVVTAVGGGGGGGGGAYSGSGGSSGTAGKTYECTVFVVSGESISVQVGAGGGGGGAGAGSGGSGGSAGGSTAGAGGKGGDRFGGGGGGGGGASGINSKILAEGGSGGSGATSYEGAGGAGGAGGVGAGSDRLRSAFVSSVYGKPGALGRSATPTYNVTSGGAGTSGCVHIQW